VVIYTLAAAGSGHPVGSSCVHF